MTRRQDGDNFDEGLREGVINSVCSMLENPGEAGRIFDQLEFVAGAGSGSTFSGAQFRAAAGRLCGFDPNNYGELPAAGTPKQGQCDTLYRVRFNFRGTRADGSQFVGTNFPGFSSFFVDLPGPIGDPKIIDDGSGNPIWVIPFNGGERNVGSTNGVETDIETSLETTRLDGLPDDCGDIPSGPENLQPGDGQRPVSIDYTNVDGDINVDGDLRIGNPVVDIDGSLRIPFEIGGAAINVNGDLNFNDKTVVYKFLPVKPPKGDCCTPAGPDDEPEDNDEKPEEPEDNRVIVGVAVNSVVDNSVIKSSRIGQDDGPNFYHPRLGNIHFIIAIGESLFWTRDIPVRNVRQFIECPVPFGAVGVDFHSLPGVAMTIKPVYDTLLDEDYLDA